MDCNVIKDLIPLYIEKLTSEASNSLIEEHIKDCKACRQTLSELQSDIIIENQVVEFNELGNLPNTLINRIKEHMYEKILITVLITLIIGVLIGILNANIFMFIAFLGSISIIAFTIAIFVSIPICRRKPSLRKQFKSLGNWVFLISIVISGFSFIIFNWYFNEPNKVLIIIALEILYNIILTLTLRIYARFRLPKEDIVDTKNPLNTKLFIVTFITLISIVAVILVPVTFFEGNRIVDNVNLPFINDSEVLGKWTAVDFVRSPEQFNTKKPYWTGSLFLNNLIFLEDGKINVSFINDDTKNTVVPSPWLLWTRGVVLNLGGDHTASKYIIKEVDGSIYMFYEWKSGDYTYFHKQPSYYVLKKDAK